MSESSFLNPTKAVAAAKIHEGMTVADFGSGSGFFARAAARAVGPGGVVYAVDAHRDLLLRLKGLSIAEGLHNVEILRGDLEHREGSNLAEESVDFVILSNVLFSAEDKNALIEEAWRVLKRNGSMLLIDWKDSFGGLGPPVMHIISEAAARTLSQSGGFEYIENIPAGEFHWGFIARKK